MKFDVRAKISAILLVLALILINFYGVNFGTTPAGARASGTQPYNSFKQYIWGGLGNSKDDMLGWNITIIENLNGDAYPDLVVCTPWYDSSTNIDVGVVYIFYGSANTGFNDINYSHADVTIQGDGLGHKFGWDVADAGDMNNDGINDLIVGAPGVNNDRGRAYIFYGGSIPNGITSATTASNRILDGLSAGGYYGIAVSGIGDIDKDGFDDVVVGAPGSDEAILTYGYDKISIIYPNIWDDDLATLGVVTFDKGANNYVNETYSDNNTWGRLAGDDGWDWIDAIDDTIDRVYGHHVTTPTHGTTIDLADCYGPWEPDGADGDNLTRNNRSALQVIAGRTRETSNPYGPAGSGDPMTSAAWGIEFNITSEMMNYISSNSTIKISFNYESWDNEKIFNSGTTAGTEELCTVRSRIWNSSGKYYLGDIIKNNDRYIFYHYQEYGTPEWNTVSGSFEYDITEFIDGAGTYYWDFGCSFGYSDTNQNNNDPDEGITTYFDDISMVITNDRHVRIQGLRGSGFGFALTGIGDIDSNGYPEVLIGAPQLDNGYAVLFPGKKRYNSIASCNLATVILTGKADGDKFGTSVANAGDVDNDGLQDIIIGAPGGNYANLYYGSTINTPPLTPDLWENPEEQGTPQIEFNSGFQTTGNTPGPAAGDDGWDTWDGVYGSSGTAGSSVKYNNANNPNPTNVANDGKLLVGIGAHFGNSAEPDSGAYGIEFSVTQEMITAIEAGGDAVISYDWYFENLELESDETVWMKTFIRDSSNNFDLGWDLDEAATGSNKDQYNEVYWSANPEDNNDVFIQTCSECFSGQGSYYLDVGGKVRAWTSSNTNFEDGIFHFDNVYLRFNPPPDAQFISATDCGFGASVGYSDKLNIDNYGDIIIGAPYYDSINGVDSGAIFGFFSGLSNNRIYDAKNAEFITYGENAGDNFGWTLSAAVNLDSDDFPEVITSAINFDSQLKNNVGRIYLLSITKLPRIRLLYPLGGEILNGEVTVNATVVDPDDNIDNTYGVRFYYSTDLNDWTQFGKDITPSTVGNVYEDIWNVSEIPDGYNYVIKAQVRDLELNMGENISLPVTIDNPHPPEISIKNPEAGETIAGFTEIKALIKDSELDLIGGGINITKGVKFYFSKDQESWELLQNVGTGKDYIYNITLNTKQYPDGEYWVKVNATDWDGFEVEEIINFTIDNPGRAPNITLLSPRGKTELLGMVKISAKAFDYDGDINSSGVTFYISNDIESDEEKWLYIGNDPEPEINETGIHVYSIIWDTTTVLDDWYYLKAFARDSENLTNESISPEFKVHNNEVNPPVIKLIAPRGGETLIETQIISAYVRDLEDNIDAHGVDYSYSSDRFNWHFIGNTPSPRVTDNETYDFIWQTATIPDGEYWLNVSVSDTTSLMSWDIIDKPIFIHNSIFNPPILKFLTPLKGQHINRTFNIQVMAHDLENNIDDVGVVLYYSTDRDDWNIINNVPSAKTDTENIYEMPWDTTTYPDGKYWFRAEASDNDELKGEVISDYFFIHNKLNNPPVVTFLGPNSGNLSGQTRLNASVFDLEDNLDENGVKFYYSTDKITWQLILSDITGSPMDDGNLYYEITWDTTRTSDDIYWLRADAMDLTSLVGEDISDSYVIVHNNKNNPPRIIFRIPQKGVPLALLETIIVEVIDFENDVESVSFYYTNNNRTWNLIDTRYKPEKGNLYRQLWNTEDVYNGIYYIKIIAKDKMGNQNVLIEGPFEIKEGKELSERASDEFPYWAIILIIIIIIIFILIAVIVTRRGKRRAKELMEEVAVEMLEAGKIEDGKKTSLGLERSLASGITPAIETDQTYIPPSEAPIPEIPEYEPDVETIESYKAQMETWKSEGYDISQLEQYSKTDDAMFARTFPIVASNISKLINISRQLDTMNTTGYESQVASIKTKLFSPDQALVAEREFKDLEQKLGLTASVAPALETTPTEKGPTPELPKIDEMLPQLLPAETGPSTTKKPSSDDTQQGGEDKKSEDKKDL